MPLNVSEKSVKVESYPKFKRVLVWTRRGMSKIAFHSCVITTDAPRVGFNGHKWKTLISVDRYATLRTTNKFERAPLNRQ